MKILRNIDAVVLLTSHCLSSGQSNAPPSQYMQTIMYIVFLCSINRGPNTSLKIPFQF